MAICFGNRFIKCFIFETSFIDSFAELFPSLQKSFFSAKSMSSDFKLIHFESSDQFGGNVKGESSSLVPIELVRHEILLNEPFIEL